MLRAAVALPPPAVQRCRVWAARRLKRRLALLLARHRRRAWPRDARPAGAGHAPWPCYRRAHSLRRVLTCGKWLSFSLSACRSLRPRLGCPVGMAWDRRPLAEGYRAGQHGQERPGHAGLARPV